MKREYLFLRLRYGWLWITLGSLLAFVLGWLIQSKIVTEKQPFENWCPRGGIISNGYCCDPPPDCLERLN
jgi:hypothetical protein